MEFPEVGQQCSNSDCKLLDYLPIRCECGKYFCTHHHNEHVLICSLAKDNVKEAHELQKIEKVYHCSEVNCKEKSIVPLICENCGQHFCVKHRHFSDCATDAKKVEKEKLKYALAQEQCNNAKANVDLEVNKNLSKALKNSKKQEMALKIMLMKIKSKASGLKTIPTADRAYFNIIYTKNGAKSEAAVFVSRIWSIGKSIDSIADECKIENLNNKLNSKKLHLFTSDDVLVSENMSQSVEHLIASKIINEGESLTLKHV